MDRLNAAQMWTGWFAGSRVILTGGAGGIGLATLDAFLAGGARVAVVDLPLAPGSAEIAPSSGVRYFPASLGSQVRGEEVVRECLGWLGGLDILVNNAGITVRATLENSGQELVDRVIETNLLSAFFMSRAAVPALKESTGCIVNVASINALRGNDLLAAYAASKGGLASLSRALAVELAPYGIRVNCVCPGTVLTPMTDTYVSQADDPSARMARLLGKHPLGRLAQASEVADSILFLSSSAASFINGVALPVDGGRSIA